MLSLSSTATLPHTIPDLFLVIGEMKICLQVLTVSGPVMRMITLLSQLGLLIATIVSLSSYIRHYHRPKAIIAVCFSTAPSTGMIIAAALHVFVKRLGFFLFDLTAGLARRSNQALRFGFFLFPDVLANNVLLENAGKSAGHNIQIHPRRRLV